MEPTCRFQAGIAGALCLPTLQWPEGHCCSFYIRSSTNISKGSKIQELAKISFVSICIGLVIEQPYKLMSHLWRGPVFAASGHRAKILAGDGCDCTASASAPWHCVGPI